MSKTPKLDAILKKVAADVIEPTSAPAPAAPGIMDKAKAIGQGGVDLVKKYPWQAGGIAAGTVLGGVLLHNWLKNKEKKKARKIAGVYDSLINAAKRAGKAAPGVIKNSPKALIQAAKKNPATTAGLTSGAAGLAIGSQLGSDKKTAPTAPAAAPAPAAEPGLMDKVTGFGNKAVDYVKNNPWEAAGIGAGAGLGIYGLYQLLKSKDSDEEA